MSKQQEQMNKRFDEKFGEKIKHVNYCLSEGDEMLDVVELKSFLQSEINLAVAEERKRIVDMIEKLDSYWRHPMALFPKERTPQKELKEMKVKEDILYLITKEN